MNLLENLSKLVFELKLDEKGNVIDIPTPMVLGLGMETEQVEKIERILEPYKPLFASGAKYITVNELGVFEKLDKEDKACLTKYLEPIRELEYKPIKSQS